MNQAPNFELPYLHSNKTYQLHEDRGKVIVMTFWTSWCPDCGRDLPKKEQLYKTMDHSKVKMLTINVTGRERNAKEAIEYAEKFLSQTTLKDKDTTVYDCFESKGVPTTIIIDKEGNIHDQFGDQAPFLDIVKSLGTLV